MVADRCRYGFTADQHLEADNDDVVLCVCPHFRPAVGVLTPPAAPEPPTTIEVWATDSFGHAFKTGETIAYTSSEPTPAGRETGADPEPCEQCGRPTGGCCTVMGEHPQAREFRQVVVTDAPEPTPAERETVSDAANDVMYKLTDIGHQLKWREADRLGRAIEQAIRAAKAETLREVEQLKKLAREATNGWACYARTKKEHAEIARLHREIDKFDPFFAALRGDQP